MLSGNIGLSPLFDSNILRVHFIKISSANFVRGDLANNSHASLFSSFWCLCNSVAWVIGRVPLSEIGRSVIVLGFPSLLASLPGLIFRFLVCFHDLVPISSMLSFSFGTVRLLAFVRVGCR